MSYDFRARTNTHALSSFFYYFATYQLFLRNEQKIYDFLYRNAFLGEIFKETCQEDSRICYIEFPRT